MQRSEVTPPCAGQMSSGNRQAADETPNLASKSVTKQTPLRSRRLSLEGGLSHGRNPLPKAKVSEVSLNFRRLRRRAENLLAYRASADFVTADPFEHPCPPVGGGSTPPSRRGLFPVSESNPATGEWIQIGAATADAGVLEKYGGGGDTGGRRRPLTRGAPLPSQGSGLQRIAVKEIAADLWEADQWRQQKVHDDRAQSEFAGPRSIAFDRHLLRRNHHQTPPEKPSPVSRRQSLVNLPSPGVRASRRSSLGGKPVAAEIS